VTEPLADGGKVDACLEHMDRSGVAQGAKPPQKLRWTNAGRWGGLWRFHPGRSLSRLVDREVFATLPLIER
jgi:hypothetical protein